MALPGLRRRRPHRLHRARPRRRRSAFLVDVLGCEYLYSLGPFRHDDSDWMAEHLDVHPARGHARTRFFRCGGQADLRGVRVLRAGPATTDRRATATSAATTSRSTSTTSTPPSTYLREHGRHACSATRPRARGPAEGQRWIYFLSALGHAVRAGQLPRRQGVRPASAPPRRPRATRRSERHRAGAAGTGAASERIAGHLRDGDPRAASIGPGERIRQEEVAERLGASRLPVREALRMLEAEGLTEHEAQQGRPGAAARRRTRST